MESMEVGKTLIPFKRMVDFSVIDEQLTEAQLSEILGRSVYTIQKDRCYKRGVPYIKVGHNVRYRLGDVLNYIKACRIDPAL